MTERSASAANRVRQLRRLLEVEGAGGIVRRIRLRAASRLAPSEGTPLPVSKDDFRLAAEFLASGAPFPAPLPWTDGEPLDDRLGRRPAEPGLRRPDDDLPDDRGARAAGPPLRRVPPRPARLGTRAAPRDGGALVARRTRRDPRRRRRHRGRARHLRHLLGVRVPGARLTCARAPACTSCRTSSRSFYPAGSQSLLAEATYRFGFHGVTAGRWLAQRLAQRLRHGRRPLRLRLRPDTLPRSTRRPAPEQRGPASATTAAPRRRGGRTSWRGRPGALRRAAPRRRRSTCTASELGVLPFRGHRTTGCSPRRSSTTSTTAASPG